MLGCIMAKNVAHLIDDKGGDVWHVAPAATVYEALEMMAHRNVGALVVLDSEALVGIVSERDYARKVILVDRGSRETLVREIMTSEPITVSRSTSVTECMEIMTDNRFRHLPVVEDGRVCGIISIGDVVRAVIEEQRFLIDQLEGYITQ